MAIEVYWAPCGPPQIMKQVDMYFVEPDLLLRELIGDKDTNNTVRNYMNCPGFLRSMTNMFVWRNGIAARVRLEPERIVAIDGPEYLASLFLYKQGSRIGRQNIKFCAGDVIFFCSQPLILSVWPAFLHDSDFQTKLRYIPGSFDISKWFRPPEGEYELKPDVAELNFSVGDPFFYVQFMTSEAIKFTRFEITPEIHQVSQGCMHYKNYRPNAPLAKVYEVFCQSNTDAALLDLIKSAVKQPR